jgi:hypothetical protein
MTSKAPKSTKTDKPKAAAKPAKKAPAKKAAASSPPKTALKPAHKAPQPKAARRGGASNELEAAVTEIQEHIADHEYATSAVSRQESIDFHKDIAQYCTERANEIQEEMDNEEPDEDTDGGEPDTDDLDLDD